MALSNFTKQQLQFQHKIFLMHQPVTIQVLNAETVKQAEKNIFLVKCNPIICFMYNFFFFFLQLHNYEHENKK